MAKAGSLGSATINLNLEYAKVSKGIDQVNKRLAGFQKGVQRMSRALGGVFAVGSVYGFSRALSSTLNELDKIGKTAAKIGVTTSALQELRFAAEQSGVGVSALDMGMQRFVRRTAEAAKGTGVLKEEFAALNIGLTNSDGTLRSVDAVLGDYADAIANAKDSQEQLRLAFKAFDSEGAALVNLFRNGKVGVDELRQELRDLGGVIDGNLIAKSEAANDAMNRVSKAMGGTMKTALAALAPIIETVANAIVTLSKRWRTFWEGMIPLAELSMEQLHKQANTTAARIGELEDAIATHNKTLKEAGGAYRVNESDLTALTEELAQARTRYKDIVGEMENAERTGTALHMSTDILSDSLENLGGAGTTAATGLEAAAKAANRTRSAYKSMFDVTTRNLTQSMDKWSGIHAELDAMFEDEKSIKVGVDKQSVFDMKEAMLNVQNNVQSGFSDMFYDVFSGKGVDSFKDFASRVFDIFKRLLADMAAAWATAKIFDLPVNFGGGFGGGIGQGSGSVTAIAKKIGSWLGIGGGGSLTSAAPGALGSVKGPAVLNYAGGASSGAAAGSGTAGAAGWGWAAVPAIIAAFGFSKINDKQKERAKRQAEFFSQVQTKVSESVNGTWDFRGMLDEATAFFSTTREGWQSTVVALKEAGVAVEGWGASLDESGRGLVKIQGDIAGVKSALSGAVATGYDFVGSLSNAIEKGNSLRVSIQGDAEAIESALQAATAMGIGGFVGLEKTANGVSATLTGNIELWDKYLQGFVNEAINSAVRGVSALGGAASDATKDFITLADAAANVKVNSSILGGRSSQVDGLPKYAEGGISKTPAIFGEAGPEAAVPLPDGRTIPVSIKGGMGNAEVVRAIKDQTRAIRKTIRTNDYSLNGR